MNNGFEADHFHDVVAEILHVKDIKDAELLTPDNLRKFYDMLPLHIINDAKAWGCRDTVFRDNAYVWLLENWDAALKVVRIKSTMRVGITVTTYITVEMPVNANPEEVLHTISDNMDYDFIYDSDGIRITDTEIMEVALQ